METSLHYNPESKELSFRVDERITARPGIELKGRAFLNTNSGAFTWTGSLTKFVSTGTVFKGQGTQPLRIGAGVSLSSSMPEPLLVASAHKSIELLEGNSTVLTARAELTAVPSTRKVGAAGWAQLPEAGWPPPLQRVCRKGRTALNCRRRGAC
jgi:hypothetical protein